LGKKKGDYVRRERNQKEEKTGHHSPWKGKKKKEGGYPEDCLDRGGKKKVSAFVGGEGESKSKFLEGIARQEGTVIERKRDAKNTREGEKPKSEGRRLHFVTGSGDEQRGEEKDNYRTGGGDRLCVGKGTKNKDAVKKMGMGGEREIIG